MSGKNDSPASNNDHPAPLPRPALSIAGIWLCFAVRQEIGQPFPTPTPRMLLTGMGPANARRVLQQHLASHTPLLLLSCGLAGALNPRLQTGDVLFETDDDFPWKNHLRAAGAHPGTFHGSDRIVCRAGEKAELWRSVNADAVEMESHALRTLCRSHRIPCATVRVISDTAQEDLPVDFNRLVTPGWRLHYGRLLLAVGRRPQLIRGLRHLQRQARFASNRLARVLGRFLESATRNPAQPPSI